MRLRPRYEGDRVAEQPGSHDCDRPFGWSGTSPVPCRAEDSHSGLVRTIGNRVGCCSPRGFKSRILRHPDQEKRRTPAIMGARRCLSVRRQGLSLGLSSPPQAGTSEPAGAVGFRGISPREPPSPAGPGCGSWRCSPTPVGERWQTRGWRRARRRGPRVLRWCRRDPAAEGGRGRQPDGAARRYADAAASARAGRAASGRSPRAARG